MWKARSLWPMPATHGTSGPATSVLNSERFAAEIEEGRSTLILINSLTDMGLSALNGPMQTVPGGAVIVGGVSMLAGIFVRKPGTKKQPSRLLGNRASVKAVRF